MSMEKQNVVESERTPDMELNREDEHWDKTAAQKFEPTVEPVQSKPAHK